MAYYITNIEERNCFLKHLFLFKIYFLFKYNMPFDLHIFRNVLMIVQCNIQLCFIIMKYTNIVG